MKSFIRSEKFIFIIIAAAFLSAFLTVYLKTESKLSSIFEAEPVVIHDVTARKNEEERTVYITPSGKMYHLDGCDYLGENKIGISLKAAINTEYEACEYCQP